MVSIQLAGNRIGFRPGDSIEGTIQWQLPESPRSVELRLCWYTSGEGGEESEIVETQTFPAHASAEQASFRFEAPSEPYSFSGQLVSLNWVLELAVQPGDQFERVEIAIGPDASAVSLGRMI